MHACGGVLHCCCTLLVLHSQLPGGQSNADCAKHLSHTHCSMLKAITVLSKGLGGKLRLACTIMVLNKTVTRFTYQAAAAILPKSASMSFLTHHVAADFGFSFQTAAALFSIHPILAAFLSTKQAAVGLPCTYQPLVSQGGTSVRFLKCQRGLSTRDVCNTNP